MCSVESRQVNDFPPVKMNSNFHFLNENSKSCRMLKAGHFFSYCVSTKDGKVNIKRSNLVAPFYSLAHEERKNECFWRWICGKFAFFFRLSKEKCFFFAFQFSNSKEQTAIGNLWQTILANSNTNTYLDQCVQKKMPEKAQKRIKSTAMFLLRRRQPDTDTV